MTAYSKKLQKIRDDESLPSAVKAQQLEEVMAWALAEMSQKLAEIPDLLQAGFEGQSQAFEEVETLLHAQGQQIAEVHGEVVEVSKGLQRLTRDQEALHRTLAVPTPRRAVWWQLGLIAMAGAVVGMVVVGAVWVSTPSAGTTAEHLIREIDAVLVAQHKELPKAVQEHLARVYSQAGVPAPGQRRGSK